MNKNKITKFDYICGGLFGVFCFLFFWHTDLYSVAFDSLNYLFGAPLDFYDNSYKFRVGRHESCSANYPPTIYIILATWLYPAKLLGLIPSVVDFPGYLVYWAKLLTTLVYATSGLVFYKIAGIYSSDKHWKGFATAIWLTTPIALYSEFINSQFDIFYVLFTLIGFLAFLRGQVSWASLAFGIAITFKPFPIFVFLPLLLLFEKRIGGLLIALAVFAAPTLLVHLVYGHSAAFIMGQSNHGETDRIYLAYLDIVGWRVYYLFATFAILCGIVYLSNTSKDRLPRTAAYVYLVSAILPYLFTYWYPYWLIFLMPPIVLTTMIDRRWEKFLLLDLAGMACFVGVSCTVFAGNMDAGMFKGGYLLDMALTNSYKMAYLFDFFQEQSGSVYVSLFWGYMITQVITKYHPILGENYIPGKSSLDFNYIRRQFFFGSLIFVGPALLAVYLDYTQGQMIIDNEYGDFNYGELTSNRVFEQSFTAKGPVLKSVELLLATYSRRNSGPLDFEVVDSHNQTVVKSERAMQTLTDNGWAIFDCGSIPVITGETYKIRLTCPTAKAGNALTWWSTSGDAYPAGTATVDGVPRSTDFLFKVFFAKK